MGAAPGRKIFGDWTAMHGAAWQGHTAVSEVLLNAGAHVDCKLVDGMSEGWLASCFLLFLLSTSST
jgi:ankyrin repeat protein